MTIYGRQHAAELVREIMTAPLGPHGELPPVLIFEGERGSGKTALLTGLRKLVDGRVPYAHIDLGVGGHTGTPEVLYALAFHLSRFCPLYGALRFPRLAVGRLVLNDNTLDLNDRDRARAQIKRLLRANRRIDQVVETFRQGAGELPAELQAVTAVGAGKFAVLGAVAKLLARVLPTVIDWLASWAWSSGFVLGRAQAWYGTQGSGSRQRPVEVLIELNRWHRQRNEGEENADLRDQMLWEAFRADLHASLGRRMRKPWMPRCLVMLDNADTNLGRRFLTAAGGPSALDPLAVVATSRAPVLDHLPAEQQRKLAAGERLIPPGTDHQEEAAPGHGEWPRWVRYPLTDLTDADVTHMVSVEQPSLDQRVPRLIQQFAHGNPMATSLLLLTAKNVTTWPSGGNELGSILARLEPSPPEDTGRLQFTVEERLGRYLLGRVDADPFPTDTIEDLTTCSAARNLEQAVILARRSGLLTGDGDSDQFSSVLPSLWPLDDDAHPLLLRRLLLRRLAARDNDAAAAWSEVHGWLRAHCAARGDQIGQLYHALAGGDLRFVAAHFADWPDTETVGVWLAEVRAVVAAPANLPHDTAPAEHASRIARAPGVEPTSRLGLTARLIAKLWLAGDPFSGRQRADLHSGIARDYEMLARESYLPNGYVALTDEAKKHDRLARLWQ